MQWISWILQLVGSLFGRNKDVDVEPVLDGYEGLTVGQGKFIRQLETRQLIVEKALAESIRDRDAIKKKLGKAIGHLKRESKLQKEAIEECNRDRERLQRRIVTLEEARIEDHDYAREYGHAFNNLLVSIEVDLREHGIEPTAIAHVIKTLNEHRQKNLNLKPFTNGH
jgi:hypothetical protein